MARKLNSQTVGNVGLYYDCYRLSRRGWNAMPTTRNARGIDILIYDQDAERKLSIQVKRVRAWVERRWKVGKIRISKEGPSRAGTSRPRRDGRRQVKIGKGLLGQRLGRGSRGRLGPRYGDLGHGGHGQIRAGRRGTRRAGCKLLLPERRWQRHAHHGSLRARTVLWDGPLGFDRFELGGCWRQRRARAGCFDLEARPALRASHLQAGRRNSPFVDLIGSFAPRALDFKHRNSEPTF
jgi:hypothetical protein